MVALSTEERAAAEKRVREALGIDMVGSYPRDGGKRPRASEALIDVEREILGAQFYVFGEIWSRPALDLETRCFITLSALGALTRSDELATYVHAALNLGIAPEDILEAMMQMGVYAGIPAATSGMNVARDVFGQRGLREHGSGEALTPKVPMTLEERTASFAKVTRDLGVGMIGTEPGAKPLRMLESGPWSIVAEDLPLERDIGRIQGAYGYGEIWGRPALGYRRRSFITMAALQAVNENDQLQCHLNVALNLGITPEELHESMVQVGIYCGVSGWRNAANVARDVLLQRGIVEPVQPAAAA